MVATRQPSIHTATYDDAQIFPNLSFIQYLAIKKQQMALDGLKGQQYHSNRNKRVGMVATIQPSNLTATYDDAHIFPNLSFIQYLAIQKQ
jgi:hypothetical protein